MSQMISEASEIEEFATELADGYVKFLSIDVSEQKRRTEDSFEECLTHLEEVCSVLDGYKQNSNGISSFVADLAEKNQRFEPLYKQIDLLKQFTSEVNELLDRLEIAVTDLESQKKSGNKIKQIMDMIPKLSIAKMPRIGLLNNLRSFVTEPGPSFVEESRSSHDGTPIEELLSTISTIEASLLPAITNIHEKLRSVNQKELDPNDSPSIEEPDELDSSWQELL